MRIYYSFFSVHIAIFGERKLYAIVLPLRTFSASRNAADHFKQSRLPQWVQEQTPSLSVHGDFCRSLCSLRYGSEYVVSREGTADTLEGKFTYWLDRHGIFDRHEDTRANQDLTGLRFVAEAGWLAVIIIPQPPSARTSALPGLSTYTALSI